jgi:hypothetical protein
VRDKDGLLFVVDEEAQGAGRPVEVSLQHHRRSFFDCLISSHQFVFVINMSMLTATKREDMIERGTERKPEADRVGNW